MVYCLARVQNMYDELRRELGEKVAKSRRIITKKKRIEKKIWRWADLCELLLGNSLVWIPYESIKLSAAGTGIPRSVAIKAADQMIQNSLCETQAVGK